MGSRIGGVVAGIVMFSLLAELPMPWTTDRPIAEAGLQRPGDANQDARLDISDTVYLLQYLFTDQVTSLPCDDDTVRFLDVQPIFEAKCSPCHDVPNGQTGVCSGGTCFVSSYADTQKTVLSAFSCTGGQPVYECIISRIKAGTMPPSFSAGCSGDPAMDAGNASCLTQQEQDLVQAWVDGGAVDTVSEANLTLLDFNDDDSLDLADAVASLLYLFGGGQAHPLGSSCVDVPDCSAAPCSDVSPDPVDFFDVQPIFEAKCSPCHSMGNGQTGVCSGGTCFVSSYADTQKTVLSAFSCTGGQPVYECIISRIKAGTMPPSFSAGCSGDPAMDAGNASCLTQQEQDLVQAWVDGGAPMGIVRFSDVQPIFEAKCSPCHDVPNGQTGVCSGGTCFVSSYADTQKTVLSAFSCTGGQPVYECIISRIKAGTMPPSFSAGCSGDPAMDAGNASCLTQQEQDLVQAWVDGGAAE